MFYRLDRFSTLHRMFRRIAYAGLWRLPDWVKWPTIGFFLRWRLPYRVVNPGDLVVQIGAPWDLLRAGRSRGIHFARLVGDGGRVLIVEPDPENVRALEAFLERQELRNVTVVPLGAWSERARLRFLIDPENPAANLIEEVVDQVRTDMSRFQVTEIEVDSLESILAEAGLGVPKLVSVTTNGAENEILKGMRALGREVAFIATIADEEAIPMLGSLGFRKYGGDDRGWTFRGREGKNGDVSE